MLIISIHKNVLSKTCGQVVLLKTISTKKHGDRWYACLFNNKMQVEKEKMCFENKPLRSLMEDFEAVNSH